MASFFGLDCSNTDCKHDQRSGYRLHSKIKRNKDCTGCGRGGTAVKLYNPVSGEEETVYKCNRCSQEWVTDWETERRDLVFRENELQSCLSQAYTLGWENPVAGHACEIEQRGDRRHAIPFGYDTRFVGIVIEALPRTAVYFRWEPTAGQILTPDLIFQCVFRSDDNAHTRATAVEFQLTEAQLNTLFRRYAADLPGSLITSIPCQHCGKPLDLKAFNTLTLREVEKGD